MAEIGSIYLIDIISPLGVIIYSIVDTHNLVLFVIMLWVLVLSYQFSRKSWPSKFNLNIAFIEIIHCALPTALLIFFIIPCIIAEYGENAANCGNSVNCTGHQWYWTYEYTSASECPEQDSYYTVDSGFLGVDNTIEVCSGVWNRLFVSSTDVLHSFAVPSLTLKVDAVPGRVNALDIFIPNPGILYGDCSELCGLNHSFIPIVLEVVPIE